MPDSIEQRVAKGAAWLDTVRPGWRDAITPRMLDMTNACGCILGQVFDADAAGSPQIAGFYWARAHLVPTLTDSLEWASSHGFTITAREPGSSTRTCGAEFELLEAEWYRVLGIPTSRPAEQREQATHA